MSNLPFDLERNRNTLLGVAIFVFVAFICIWLCALFGSTAGEIAVALSGLIGGAVGAGGAILAVYLALSAQRADETQNVSDAVRTEVTTLVKYIMGAIKTCEGVVDGSQKIPVQDASYIAKNFWGEPVIYPAVADRIGLLPYPQATTEFYMRISEAKAMLEALRTKTYPPATVNIARPVEYVSADFAAKVADSLITALHLALPIVADERDSFARSTLTMHVRRIVIGDIEDCVKSARAAFPNAVSFQTPS